MPRLYHGGLEPWKNPSGYNRRAMSPFTANPYAPFLENQNPIDVLEQTARQLAKVGEQLKAGNIGWRPAPGKWNAREILCHLADCEIAFGFRLRQTLAEKNH